MEQQSQSQQEAPEFIRAERRHEHQTVTVGNQFIKRPDELRVRSYLIRAPELAQWENGTLAIHQRELTQEEFDGRLNKEISRLTKAFLSTRQGVTWYDASFYLTANGEVAIDLTERVCKGKPTIQYLDGHFHSCLNVDEKGGSAASACGGMKDRTCGGHLLPTFGGTKRKKVMRDAEAHLNANYLQVKAKLISEREMWEDMYDDSFFD